MSLKILNSKLKLQAIVCKKCSLSPFSNVDTSFFNNRQLLYSLIRIIRMAMPIKVHSESDLKSQLHSNWKQLLSWCARVVHLRRLQVNGSLLLPYLREKSPYCNQIVTYKCKQISCSDYFSIKKSYSCPRFGFVLGRVVRSMVSAKAG